MPIIKKVYLNGVAFSNPDPTKEYCPVQPPDSNRLWRYMTFAKFVSLLDTTSLFLSRADRLGDPHEGSLSQYSETRFRDWEEKTGQPQAADQIRQILLCKSYVFVNCWHELEHESDAMWGRYAQEEDGIAIVRTFGSLVESLGSFPEHEVKNIRIGRVQYVDYDVEFVSGIGWNAVFSQTETIFT